LDRLLSYIVRLMVWLSGRARLLARLHLCQYEEWQKGKPLKVLLVGYNGARNTGADARVVALVRQLDEMLGADNIEMTVMTLDKDSVRGYFPEHVRQWTFTTLFFWSLLRACSSHHVAILCEGSTLTTTFAKALSVFYCQAAGIMRRQGKQDTYFIVRTEESLENLKALGLPPMLTIMALAKRIAKNIKRDLR